MKNVIRIFRGLLVDVSHLMKVPIKAPHDIDIAWVLYEGPRLDKELLRYLETGHSAPSFPEWLSPLADDVIGDHCDPLALRYLRQILVFGYKAETISDEQQNNSAQAEFIDCDNSIATFDRYFLTARSRYCFVEARKLVSRVIGNTNFSSIEPSHGPGAVFPQCPASEKSRFNTIYTSIEPLYPFFGNFQMTSSQMEEAGKSYKGLRVEDKVVCRLTAVPKDSRGPRLISVHPKEAVWIQQGIRKSLENAISDCPLTRGNIKFHDQSVNGALALLGSTDRSFCTIDLKNASDCISAQLVEFLFGSSYQYLECCRATHVRLFDGADHPLRMYAPMGNATTFPVESLVFWAAIASGISCTYGLFCKDIYVFGDDIVLPSEYYECAIRTLTRFGLRPNQNKCFVKGWFRESCGVDAYKGVNITPIRLKQHETKSPTQLVSLCAMAKRLRARGFVNTATEIYSIVRSAHKKPLLKSNNYSCQGIYEWVDLDHWKFIEANPDHIKWAGTHQYLTKVTNVIDAKCVLAKHDWNHVLDSLLRLQNRPGDYGCGAEYPIPNGARLTNGWTPVIHYVPNGDGSRFFDPAFLREENAGKKLESIQPMVSTIPTTVGLAGSRKGPARSVDTGMERGHRRVVDECRRLNR